MTLYEAFEALRSEGAARAQGAQTIYEELMGLARESSARKDAEDCAHEIIARWLASPPQVDRNVGRGFLAKSLKNARHDRRRKLQRRPTRSAESPTVEAAAAAGVHGRPVEDGWAETDLEAEQTIAASKATLERIAEAVIAESRASLREQRRATWIEMKKLYFEAAVDRDALVEEEVKASPGASRQQIRNRFFTRHKRFREAFIQSARALARDGALDAEDLELAELVYAKVLTERPRSRQNRRSGTLET